MKGLHKLLLSIAFILSIAQPALAISSTPSYSVYPGSTNSDIRLKYMASINDIINDTIVLKNKSDQELTLQVKALDAFDESQNKMTPIDPTLFDQKINPELPKATFEGGNIHLKLNRDGTFIVSNPNAENEYVGKWTTLKSDIVKLKPGESKNIDFQITIPSDAKEYMTYTGGILVRNINTNTQDTGSSNSNVSTGVAERIYVDLIPHEIMEKYMPKEVSSIDYTQYILAGIILLLIVSSLVLSKKSVKTSKK